MHQLTQTTSRIRIAHTHTLKDGWRCSETTVELDGVPATVMGSSDGVATYSIPLVDTAIRKLLEEAYDAGRAEADRRNADDRIELGDALVARGGK